MGGKILKFNYEEIPGGDLFLDIRKHRIRFFKKVY